MSRSDEERLRDISRASERAREIVRGGEQAYRDEWMRGLAAERLLHIIGEAASKLSDDTRSRYPEIPWDEMRSFRNFITHEYHKIDSKRIWLTLENHIPVLAKALAEGPFSGP